MLLIKKASRYNFIPYLVQKGNYYRSAQKLEIEKLLEIYYVDLPEEKYICF